VFIRGQSSGCCREITLSASDLYVWQVHLNRDVAELPAGVDVAGDVAQKVLGGHLAGNGGNGDALFPDVEPIWWKELEVPAK
jgi:ABC-type cobalamin transport system permease subunit